MVKVKLLLKMEFPFFKFFIITGGRPGFFFDMSFRVNDTRPEFFCKKLGYPKIYNETCPFNFMDTMSLDGKSNFFEQRVTEYNRPEQISDKSLEELEDF